MTRPTSGLSLALRVWATQRCLPRNMEVEPGSLCCPLSESGVWMGFAAARPRPPQEVCSLEDRAPHPSMFPLMRQPLIQPWGIYPKEHQGLRSRRDWGWEPSAPPGSLITSARSAPAPSRQLPSNTREFNSSINRRRLCISGSAGETVGVWGMSPVTATGATLGSHAHAVSLQSSWVSGATDLCHRSGCGVGGILHLSE